MNMKRASPTSQIRPLAWKPPYAAGVVQENGKKTKKKKINELRKWLNCICHPYLKSEEPLRLIYHFSNTL